MRYVAFVVGLAFAVNAFAQDATKGASLLAEARKALGGDEKLRAVKTLQVKGDFKRSAGQNTIEGEVELFVELPDKLRRTEDLSLPGGGPSIIRTEVLNGTDTWEDNTGGGGQFIFRGPGGAFGRGGGGGLGRGGGGDAADGNQRGGGRENVDSERLRQIQLRARQAELMRLALALLLTSNDPVTWVGTAQSPDGTADVLEVKPAEGPAIRVFLDTMSHMPLMLTWQGAGPQIFTRRGGGRGQAQGDQPAAPPRPQQATLRMTLGEYKAVNGIKLPHLITRGVNDQTNEEWTVSSYRVNPSFKADTFTKK
jgi:hypothetical protein